jgi:hypothetical protein
MIKPTVGRNIWVHRPGSMSENNGQPEAGFITYVHSDVCINVAGFDANGVPFAATSVQLRHGEPLDAASELWPWAEWMSYQKGQAAKTEAAQDALSRLQHPDTTGS